VWNCNAAACLLIICPGFLSQTKMHQAPSCSSLPQPRPRALPPAGKFLQRKLKLNGNQRTRTDKLNEAFENFAASKFPSLSPSFRGDCLGMQHVHFPISPAPPGHHPMTLTGYSTVGAYICTAALSSLQLRETQERRYFPKSVLPPVRRPGADVRASLQQSRLDDGRSLGPCFHRPSPARWKSTQLLCPL
jgi:hypothetical protein